MTIEEIKDQLLALFPVGSEWYDAGQDSTIRITHHIRRRGLIAMSVGDDDLSFITYQALLTGRIRTPQVGGYFHEWAAQEEEVTREITEAIKGKRLWV